MEQQNCDMMSVGVVTETEIDNDDVSMEQLLSTPQTCTEVVVPFQSRPPSPGFFDLTRWWRASGFDFNTYSPPRSTNYVDSLQFQSPSPAFYEGLSPLPDAFGFDYYNSYSPPRTITPVMSAHNFTTVDSDCLRGSSSSPRGTSTTTLLPNLDGKKSKLIFKVSREELMVFRKLVPLKFADAIKEMNIQDTVLILQVTRMPTGFTFSYHDIKLMILQWALQFAAKGDCAQSKTMRGSTFEDLAFVETIDSAMDEKFGLTLQCIHTPQIAISTVQFTSDQAESENPMLVSNMSNQELLLQQQKRHLPVFGFARDLSSSSSHIESPGAGGFPRCIFQITELPSSAKDRMKQSPQCLTGSTVQHNLSQKDASTHCGKVEPECVMELDYRSEFTTSKIFKSRHALIEWARATAEKNNFHVVVTRSDGGAGNRKPRITLGCDRSGYRRDMRKNIELHQDKKLKRTGTVKCGCPFELKGQKLDTNDDWTLRVIWGKHNHPIVSHTTAEKGTASMQDATWIVTVMATYRDNTATFKISSKSGINELKEKVARRLELEPGSFNVKYEDGGNLMLIACDEALNDYVECSKSPLSNGLISLVVTDKVSNSGSSCKKSKSGKGKSPAI